MFRISMTRGQAAAQLGGKYEPFFACSVLICFVTEAKNYGSLPDTGTYPATLFLEGQRQFLGLRTKLGGQLLQLLCIS